MYLVGISSPSVIVNSISNMLVFYSTTHSILTVPEEKGINAFVVSHSCICSSVIFALINFRDTPGGVCI
jgi:hypothetical protein